MSVQTYFWIMVSTSLGDVPVIASEKEITWTGVIGTSIDEGRKWLGKRINGLFRFSNQETLLLKKTKMELIEYCNGKKIQFTGPFHLEGTPFQVSVWKEMLAIPYGKTRSYGEVAKRLGRAAASRAVGGACRANPIAILIPCHRIVGSDGSLTGYAGPTRTDLKKTLLEIESKQVYS